MTTDLSTTERLNLPSKRDLCDMTIVVDRSSSMADISADMAKGLSDFIAQQRTIRGECVVSMFSFGSEVDQQFIAAPSTACPAVELRCHGATALLDAVGTAIMSTAERLSKLAPTDLPQHVAVIIITDGYENRSRIFVTEQIRTMIQHQTDVYGWKFLFIGAHDLSGAKLLGIHPDHSATWTPNLLGTQSLLDRLMSATHQLRMTGDCKLLPERN